MKLSLALIATLLAIAPIPILGQMAHEEYLIARDNYIEARDAAIYEEKIFTRDADEDLDARAAKLEPPSPSPNTLSAPE